MTAPTPSPTPAWDPWPWRVLPLRTLLFAAFQALIAGLFLLAGRAQPWEESIAWWPVAAALANLVTVGALAWLVHREGRGLRSLYLPEKGPILRDLLASLGWFLLAAPLVILPNFLLGGLLFGDPEATVAIMFRPLPAWAVWTALIVFPLTIAFAELPAYFGYAMPRLAQSTGRGWLAVLLGAAWLALQHTTLPLVFDWRFILWRGLMFLPLALLLGIALYRRPRLLPYMMVIHALLDMQAGLMILQVSG